ALREIMSREADAQLRQVETKFQAHRAAEPRIAAGIARPCSFIEPAEYDAVRVLQTRFQQTKDTHTRIAAFRAPFGTAGAERMKNVRIVGRREHKRVGCLAFFNGLENALQLQAVSVGIGGNYTVLLAERLERFGMRLRQFAQAGRLAGER